MAIKTAKKAFETHLRKALLTSATDGAALVPYDLDGVIHEELMKLQPLAELLDVLPAGSKTHEYTVRSSHPQAWFEGETTPMNQKNSVYARKSVQTKIMRIWGGVTGYAQSVDEAFIDALATELEGSVEGLSNVLEYGAMWGCAADVGFTGDAYQFSGLFPRIAAYAPANVIDAGGDKIALADLDAALEKVTGFRSVRIDPKLWLMSQGMRNVVDGLQTAVQLPLTSAELAEGKLVMASYGNAPILETDFVKPESSTSSPAVSAAEFNGGGTLAATTYYYYLSSVLLTGEQLPGTVGSVTTAGGGDAVDLTWTADPNALLYLVFRGTTTGVANVRLIDVIAAKTYDSAGTVNGTVASYRDVGKATISTIKPLSAGEENIFIVNTNPSRGAAFVGKIDDMGRAMDRMFSYVELARVKDTYDYMVKGYLAQRLVHPNLVGVIRHAKKA